jgi:uncharacterized protein with NAD-binding domain and iron-sulfur cluster
MSTEPKRIAILGGGMASVTTALALTAEPDWKSRYEITLYQLGWRLGGKCASGRSGKIERKDGVSAIKGMSRNQEHGLHILLGFYENTFRLIRQVYAENENHLPTDAPLRAWTDAFKKHSYICVQESLDQSHWKNWGFSFPEDDLQPGDGNQPCTVWDYIRLLLDKLADFWKTSSSESDSLHDVERATVRESLNPFAGVLTRILDDVSALSVATGTELVEMARRFIRAIGPNVDQHDRQQHDTLIGLLDVFRKWLYRRLDGSDEARRVFILMDLGLTIIRGLIADGVMFDSREFDVLEEDLQSWLSKHGASELSCHLDKSAVVRGLYDLVFAYIDGETTQPSLAAGPALRAIFNILFRYKGALAWKMQAGLGDTIFAPIYMVLKRRGVKFAFFHKVQHIGLTADKSAIQRIDIARQVTLLEGGDEYDPIVWVRGVPCWPAAPDYSQIAEGDQLQRQNIDLESFWTTWKDVEHLTLEAGVHFDQVIFGISLGAVPYICSELITAAPQSWGAMVRQVRTVRTMAFQLWVGKTLQELGWNDPSPVLDAYVEPLNTWADMSQLLIREIWPEGREPKSVGYFCGQMLESIKPEMAVANVTEVAHEFVSHALAGLWPKLEISRSDLDDHAVPDDGGWIAESESRYFRANIDPSERYVQSVADATRARLRADQAGFERLVLTGDWTYNGLNIGCIEASVMAGLQAANVIAKRPLASGVISLKESFGQDGHDAT